MRSFDSVLQTQGYILLLSIYNRMHVYLCYDLFIDQIAFYLVSLTIYMINNIGPKTVPCGTPLIISDLRDL